MLFMELVELTDLMQTVHPVEQLKAIRRVFDTTDLPERVEGDSYANRDRVEVFTRALLIELKERNETP